eukprot:TRINITY_DN73283_c0_g1_i1.p1 TRINITY_DN73283_c0_g1~~TRINITY_DN73283_c0_g1_i1.p1  ORF type:complete len:190 (+),score=30.43 TRINITY_DN73283_c0_g1_i1:24-572(+)
MVSYMLVFLFVTIGIFNLIMATFIDNVLTSNIKKKQKELGENAHKQRTKVRETCWKFIHCEGASKQSHRFSATLADINFDPSNIDACKDGVSISRDIFNSWLRDPEMLAMLEEIDIETSTKFELFDVLDVDMGGELSFDEMVNGLMSLRGPISKSDIMAVRLKVRFLTKMVMGIVEKLQIDL